MCEIAKMMALAVGCYHVFDKARIGGFAKGNPFIAAAAASAVFAYGMWHQTGSHDDRDSKSK